MFSQDEIERARYLSRKMFRHDLATALDEATKKGEREGFEKGEREGYEKGEREGFEKGVRQEILNRIQLCSRLLNERQPTDHDFAAKSNVDLQKLAVELEKRLDLKT